MGEAVKGDGTRSFEIDFREPKEAERGLRGKLVDFRPEDSFKEDR